MHFQVRIHFWASATIEKVVWKHCNQFRSKTVVVGLQCWRCGSLYGFKQTTAKPQSVWFLEFSIVLFRLMCWERQAFLLIKRRLLLSVSELDCVITGRVSEGFLHKGNGFLAGSTIKERNVVFLQDLLSCNINRCNKKSLCHIFCLIVPKKSFIFSWSRHQTWCTR